MRSDEIRERMAAAIQRVDDIRVGADAARLTIHFLGEFAEERRQRNGCPPLGLIELQQAYAEALASDSRSRDSEEISAAGALALGDELVVNAEEAARMLRLKPDTVRLMCRKGTLAAKKESGRWFPTTAAVHAECRRRAERSA